jgi:hypothetical protein
MRPRVAARSPMSGASLPATWADAERSSSTVGQCGFRFSRSRGRQRAKLPLLDPSSLERELMTRAHTGMLIATLRCAARFAARSPTRGASWRRRRRGPADTKGSSGAFGQCGSADCHNLLIWVLAQRASVGCVVANSSASRRSLRRARPERTDSALFTPAFSSPHSIACARALPRVRR